jgi:hypothetical protein
MARGGKRPGAGRPKGSKDKMPSVEVLQEATGHDLADLTPLDMMLAIMRHPDMPPALRIQMAKDAAPYCHPKPTDKKPGKKEQAAEAARNAGAGSSWGDDLAPSPMTGTRPI